MSGRTVYDAAVVGAGPAGAAVATHLARAGFHVSLLDKATFPRDKPCAEYLSPAAEPLLATLGMLESLEAARPSRLRGFRVYAPGGRMFQGDFAATRDSTGHALFETGLAIPRLVLDAALVQAAVGAGAALREGWRLADLGREEDGIWRLAPAGDAEPVWARLLVGADGVHSTVARRLGLYVPGRLRKIALVAHITGIAGLSEYGEMHVANRRYVGLAPLDPPDVEPRRCNVAMVVDERRDGATLARGREAFLLDALGTFPHIRGRLARAVVVRHTLAASRLSGRARRLAGENFLLVGDAGGYFDPFTGEGIYHALRSAELAAAVAREALAAAPTRGTAGRAYALDGRTLGRYERLCRSEFRGKRAVEAIIQAGVAFPPLLDHLAAVFTRKPDMPHAVIAVTGDFLPPRAILRPGFLLRLVL
jgi:flavin-dependent dehydrogenase